MKFMDESSIIGAGPAGLSAAINLAKAGYEVNVFEKNKSVGGRFNGDFQGLENWSENIDPLKKLKYMGIDDNFETYPFSKLTISNGLKKWDFFCNGTSDNFNLAKIEVWNGLFPCCKIYGYYLSCSR